MRSGTESGVTSPSRQVRPPGTGPVLAGLAVGLVGLWAVLSLLGALPTSFFPSPLTVAGGLYGELRGGRLADDVLASLFRVGAGLAVAVGFGVPLGLWLGHSAWARGLLLPAINFLRSLSPLAW